MGDIADMMLDGTLCQHCGDFLGDSVGYPRSCAGCKVGADEAHETLSERNRRRRIASHPILCPFNCGKRFKLDRDKDKHVSVKHAKRLKG